MTKRYSFVKNFSWKLGTKKEWSCGSALAGIREHAIKWFTDGSKTLEGTGAGVFGPRIKYSEPMGKYPSIFQAEIHAIGRCVQFNLDRKYRNQEIVILSDSQAAIKALSSHMVSSKIVWECLGTLNDLGRANKVTLFWVPGHVGIEGNEVADALAKKGAGTPLVGPEPFCGVSSQYLLEVLRGEEEAKRYRLWNSLPGLRQAKICLGNYNHKRSQACIRLCKNKLRILTGFLTGHCRLRGHLRKLGLEDDSTCRFCGEGEETPIHLLAGCGAVIQRRFRTLGCYQEEEEHIPFLEPSRILKFLRDLDLVGVL
uniref:Putative loa-9 aae n=1 Tax=Triatoma dimidiata TaxID=72491 RepID=A0A0V0GBP9_TRIDM